MPCPINILKLKATSYTIEANIPEPRPIILTIGNIWFDTDENIYLSRNMGYSFPPSAHGAMGHSQKALS